MREVRAPIPKQGRIAHALRLRPWLLIPFLTATMLAPTTLVMDEPLDMMRFSLSAGSFSVINNIVPRVELEAHGLLSIPAQKPTAHPQASFPVDAAD